MHQIDSSRFRIQFVTLWASDLEASRRFYVDLLGFHLLSEKEDAFFQVVIAGVPFCFDLHARHEASGSNQIGIEVEDVDAVARMLQENGLHTEEGGRPDGGERWVLTKDPDGHELIFIEPKR